MGVFRGRGRKARLGGVQVSVNKKRALENSKIRCDVCGKFISYNSIANGEATVKLLTPDSYYSTETHEYLCKDHILEVFK